ncbi:hypothetical protein CAPTEDRAFT_111807 [Capitella teleta]|uniref:Choline/carnitine acyltransferase domain-containing protein n=1 Tax=Capitella teleta TaxID=283909 RepID=X1YV61_CAPTE|nr:hypothetical protein CAPTEDRAFT_111807 [Capitella teleta]|eukprot:ELU04678.1 hypothetical protein CAPTEDRAFT_111807 [Capitella teleta]
MLFLIFLYSHFHTDIPHYLRVVLISASGGLTFFVMLMYTRRWILRLLLSYHGWMYEGLHTMSWSTTLWAVMVRLVSGYHPTTYSCQNSLPFLPVPSLDTSINQFVRSIEPLYEKPEESEEFQKIKNDAEVFRTGLGPKLQRMLVLKSWWAQNWLADWWYKYVYLMGRNPIAINSNYYCLDHSHWCPTNLQISRAANGIYQFLKFKRQLDREELEPLIIRNTVPLCMAQYERIFSCTRIPGEDVDELKQYPASQSKHIIVMRKGIYYQVQITDLKGQPLTPQTLESQISWIIADADEHFEARSVAALTGINRTEWAAIRDKYFSSGVNQETLHALESAVFHAILDTNSFSTWSERGKYLLHGDGRTQWFDKSFSLLYFTDGRCGINVEHSWGDAPVMAHCSEYNLTKEVMEPLYDEKGRCVPLTRYKQAALSTPQRLLWDITPDLGSVIYKSVTFNQKNNEDLSLQIVEHTAYGKGFIKTCKVSPDAYIQCALQLAYFKDSGKFALTYEASMTRLFLLGRTETVRSLTSESVDFVRAMRNDGCSNAERIALLKKACSRHQDLYRDAMNGKGFDRHMFGLFVACRGLGHDSEFLKDSLMMPWTLSTSQQPQQQMRSTPDCNAPAFMDKVCPGGGFGPVTDNGYGVSYMVPGDYKIFFHISSKRSCPKTDSERFAKLLFESFAEMRSLFSTE